MNSITEPLRALVRRKLWPVALLLVGALVAVPVLLSKQPADTTITAVATPAPKDDGIAATFVSAAEPSDGADVTTTKRRRTLGDQKDPFEPAPLPKKKKKAVSKQAKATAAKATTSTPETKPSTSSSAGGATTAPAASAPMPVATPTPTPKTIIPAGSLQIRFGTTDADPLPSRLLKKSTPLPSDEAPAFVYTGLDSDDRAVFMLTGEVTPEGDGKCLPTPENCQTLKLRAGETEFLSVPGEGTGAAPVQYELDVVKVHTKPFAVAAKAH